MRRRIPVLGCAIDAIAWADALAQVLDLAQQRRSAYICLCNVHSVVTGWRDKAFRAVIEHAHMATPDGAPVAWALRRLGVAGQARINGPDLMWRCCALAEEHGVSVFLMGGSEATLAQLQNELSRAFPRLTIAGSLSPPYRALSAAETDDMLAAIAATQPGMVFVALGCPKQEHWMARHHARIPAPMLGVGAAFDYHAKILPRAPAWMREHGLEWAHRVMTEPRRLWKRYLVTNSLFVIGIAWQLLQRLRTRQ
jgi:N-acetylglucosaminyldiphosphoundecaprenol N-acetyl-beta-D-mannosaminyltransferase